MMKTSLEKLIKKVILKKYLWINDFEVIYKKGLQKKYYMVNYFLDTDSLPGSKTMEVEDETRNLFKVLGPDKDEEFIDVEFFLRGN